MLSVTRKQKVKEYVLEKKSASVTELSNMFSVTDETIRRDLKALEAEGVLMRSYGGAFIQSGVENLVHSSIRTSVYVDNKKRIAARSRELINNGDAVFMDNSTTSFYLAELIKDMRITLVTNSLMIINLMAGNKNTNLIVIGGTCCHTEKAFYGIKTKDALNEYYVDKAFLSCRSLSIENGITESNERWGLVRQSAIKRAKESYIIADFSKYDHTSFVRICGFEDITGIITDAKLSPQWHKEMDRYGCKVMDDLPELQ